MNAYDVLGPVFKNGSATLLARVVGSDGTVLQQADIASVAYTIYLLDDDDPDAAAEIEGHTDEAVDVASLIYDSLQTDDLWGTDVDTTGYNFKHVLDVSTDQAFEEAGRDYLVVFDLTPASGQVILVRFRVNAI